MKLVVGLGNPGSKYRNTRHNAGFLLADKLTSGSDFLILKPDKFMNRSGIVLKAFLKKHPKIKLKDVYVIHDDLDIELGKFKITFGKGPRVHNGLRSIYEQIGSKDFWHVRIGIDNRLKTGFVGTGEDYVLGKWRPEEKVIVEQAISKAVAVLKHG